MIFSIRSKLCHWIVDRFVLLLDWNLYTVHFFPIKQIDLCIYFGSQSSARPYCAGHIRQTWPLMHWKQEPQLDLYSMQLLHNKSKVELKTTWQNIDNTLNIHKISHNVNKTTSALFKKKKKKNLLTLHLTRHLLKMWLFWGRWKIHQSNLSSSGQEGWART